MKQKKTLNGKKPSEALAKRKSFQFPKDSWLHPAAQSDNVFKATEEIHLLPPEKSCGETEGCEEKKEFDSLCAMFRIFPIEVGITFAKPG